MIQEILFSDIPNIRVGHAQNREAVTGCTVVLCETGAVAGVDVRGGAPGTRETDLLNPSNLVERIHGVVLAGGSAFGLDAATGVMRYLEEKDIGFDVQVTHVPIVCAAVLFDLLIGDSRIRPDSEMGYQACLDSESGNCGQGSIGAGTGATVGKILGMNRAMKSGLGTFALQAGDLRVGAMVAVNCLGDVIDPLPGIRLAGLLREDRKTLDDTESVMARSFSGRTNLFAGNTTIGVVVTNASLNKAQCAKLASMSQNGYARTLRPAHSMVDGDTVFALSAGSVKADLSVVGMLSARAMERAVVAAVVHAESLGGLPCFSDLVS